MRAATMIMAPPIQARKRAIAEIADQSVSIYNDVPRRLAAGAHSPETSPRSVGLGDEAVLLADQLGPLGGARLAAALGPLLEHEVVEHLVARLEVRLGGLDELELAGRSGRALAGAGGAIDAVLGLGLDRLPGLVLERFELLLEEGLRLGRQLVPGVDVDEPQGSSEADGQAEQR